MEPWRLFHCSTAPLFQCSSVLYTVDGPDTPSGGHPQPLRETSVVTCFLLRTDPEGVDEVLILRRSGRVRTYKGRWAAVSGYLEGEPEEQARREIREETGLADADVELLRAGEPFTFDDPELDTRWTVHPFLFRVHPGGAIAIDWEHTEARWVRPGNLGRYRTVPRLKEALDRVYPTTQGAIQ